MSKDLTEMTLEELEVERKRYEEELETAPGWASAFALASGLAGIIANAKRRFGVEWENKFPIRRG